MNYERLESPYTPPRLVASDRDWTIILYEDLDGDWRWDVYAPGHAFADSADGGYERTEEQAKEEAELSLQTLERQKW